MSRWLDMPADIRTGEELPIERLALYLRNRIPDWQEPITVRQFPNGHSNLTYLIETPRHEFVLRRPPFGSHVKSAHDMGREYRVLARLNDVYEPAPHPLLHCDDESVIGAPFYLMERVKGVILRSAPPPDLTLTQSEVRRCCEAAVANLATLHSIDYEHAGLAELRRPGVYMERQVDGWTRRYLASQTHEIPEILKVARWLKENVGKDSGAVLIHNDYKFDNLVLDPDDFTRIRGVLDWEMATIGDPLSDLGVALSYWTEPGDRLEHHSVQCFLTTMPGALSRREVVSLYGDLSGRDVSSILPYYVFGLLKLAVIVQQIYFRYAQGLTRDPRFASMIELVGVLGRHAVSSIARSSIGPP